MKVSLMIIYFNKKIKKQKKYMLNKGAFSKKGKIESVKVVD